MNYVKPDKGELLYKKYMDEIKFLGKMPYTKEEHAQLDYIFTLDFPDQYCSIFREFGVRRGRERIAQFKIMKELSSSTFVPPADPEFEAKIQFYKNKK